MAGILWYSVVASDENYMRRRFFEGLQQRVEGRSAEHVDFIDDEDLVPVAGRDYSAVFSISSRTSSTPVLEAASISRTSMQLPAAISMQAGRIAARFARLAVMAVQRLRQNAGRRGFAAAARSGEKKGMRDAAALKRIQQGAGDMLLPYEFMEVLGTPFAG